MKKSFLILGIISCICATDSYAAVAQRQNKMTLTAGLVTVKTCPEGCVLKQKVAKPNTSTTIEDDTCVYKDNTDMPCGKPTVQTMDEAGLNNYFDLKTQTRSAKIMVPQKIVYKEIYFDDSVDEFEE